MDNNLNSKEKFLPLRTSNSIVYSVLEAAALILTRSGYKKSTTNHIAEKAGVSIGSLYYYFRGKDAVYQKLTDEVMASYVGRLEGKLSKLNEVQEIHEVLINEVVDFTFENRELLQKLFAMSSRLGKLETVFNFRNHFAKTLALRLGNISEEDAFVLVNAINGVMDNFIYGTTCPLSRQEMKSALTRLTVRFVAK